MSAGEKFVAVLGSSTKGILQVNQRDIKIKLFNYSSLKFDVASIFVDALAR